MSVRSPTGSLRAGTEKGNTWIGAFDRQPLPPWSLPPHTQSHIQKVVDNQNALVLAASCHIRVEVAVMVLVLVQVVLVTFVHEVQVVEVLLDDVQ